MDSNQDEAAYELTPKGPDKFILTNLDNGVSERPRRFMRTTHTPRTKGNATITQALGVPACNVELFDTPGGSVATDAASTLGVMGKGSHLEHCLTPNGTSLQLFYRYKDLPEGKPKEPEQSSDKPSVKHSTAPSALQTASNSSAAAGSARTSIAAAGSVGHGSAAVAAEPAGTAAPADAHPVANKASKKRRRPAATDEADEDEPTQGLKRARKGSKPLGNPYDDESVHRKLKDTLFDTMAWHPEGHMFKLSDPGFWKAGYRAVMSTFCATHPHLDKQEVQKSATQIIRNYSSVKVAGEALKKREKLAEAWANKYMDIYMEDKLPANDPLFGTQSNKKRRHNEEQQQQAPAERPTEPTILEPGMNQYMTFNPELTAAGIPTSLGAMPSPSPLNQTPQAAPVMTAGAAVAAATSGLGSALKHPTALTSKAAGRQVEPIAAAAAAGKAATAEQVRPVSKQGFGTPAVDDVSDEMYCYLDQAANKAKKQKGKAKQEPKTDQDKTHSKKGKGRTASQPDAKQGNQQRLPSTRSGRARLANITTGSPTSTAAYYRRKATLAKQATAAEAETAAGEGQQWVTQQEETGSDQPAAAAAGAQQAECATRNRDSLMAAWAAAKAASAGKPAAKSASGTTGTAAAGDDDDAAAVAPKGGATSAAAALGVAALKQSATLLATKQALAEAFRAKKAPAAGSQLKEVSSNLGQRVELFEEIAAADGRCRSSIGSGKGVGQSDDEGEDEESDSQELNDGAAVNDIRSEESASDSDESDESGEFEGDSDDDED